MNLFEYFRSRDTSQDATASMPWPVAGAVRADLPAYFCDLGFTKGAEVGVWDGVYSEALCQANPALHLTCVDPWTKYPEYLIRFRQPREDGSVASGEEAFQCAYAAAVKRLQPYGCTLVRDFSVKAAEGVPDGSLDFVYLDGNHQYEYVMEDISAWLPKIRAGGILSGHDYVQSRQIDVVAAVDAWTTTHAVRPWFVLGRGRRRASERGEKYRSWLWVKS